MPQVEPLAPAGRRPPGARALRSDRGVDRPRRGRPRRLRRGPVTGSAHRHPLRHRRAGGAERVPVTFEIADESDPGPYPIPRDAPIEGGPDGDGDRHVIVVDRDALPALRAVLRHPRRTAAPAGARSPAPSGTWRRTRMRPRGLDLGRRRRAADPARPGAAGRGARRARSTTRCASPCPPRDRPSSTPRAHYASDDPDPNLPAMGERLRLKQLLRHQRLPPPVQGGPPGAQDLRRDRGRQRLALVHQRRPVARWNDDDLRSLERVPGSAWEVVDSTKLRRPALGR